MSFAVLQRAGAHHLAEYPAEMGGAGKAGLLRHRADGQLCGLQQLLSRFDAAVVEDVYKRQGLNVPIISNKRTLSVKA